MCNQEILQGQANKLGPNHQTRYQVLHRSLKQIEQENWEEKDRWRIERTRLEWNISQIYALECEVKHLRLSKLIVQKLETWVIIASDALLS